MLPVFCPTGTTVTVPDDLYPTRPVTSFICQADVTGAESGDAAREIKVRIMCMAS